MNIIKQVMSFRGSVADDIARKIPLRDGGGMLGDSLFNFMRENADVLVCCMEGDMIVIGKSGDAEIGGR